MLATSPEQTILLDEPIHSASRRAALDERRCAPRVRRPMRATLRPMGYADPIIGRSKDVSEGGVYLLVDLPQTLSVGQRCELDLVEEDGRPPVCFMTSDCCYATVVRTERVTHGESQLLGAGLRFDQPIFFS